MSNLSRKYISCLIEAILGFKLALFDINITVVCRRRITRKTRYAPYTRSGPRYK